MDRKLVSRLALARELHVESQTIAKWERQGLMPQPVQYISDRVILYDREAVDQAIRKRSERRCKHVPPQRKRA
jgi:predicted site-specific integrase-resolvase